VLNADLLTDLDHFTKHVIRKELRALTAMPVKDPSDWMFSGDNDNVFDDPSNARLHPTEKTKRKYPGLYDHTAELRRTPATWVQAGETQIMRALALTGGVRKDILRSCANC
jgi:putative membrane protein